MVTVMKPNNFVANGEVLRDFIGMMTSAKVVSNMPKYMMLIITLEAAKEYAAENGYKEYQPLNDIEDDAAAAIFKDDSNLCKAIILDILEGRTDVNNLPEYDLDVLNSNIINELNNAFIKHIDKNGFKEFMNKY